MKEKFLTLAVLLMVSVASYAQAQVTRFMGIPVDGFKKDMIQKLEAKGFEISESEKDVLTGEFNGSDVNVFVVTNNNKVCRIMVSDKDMMDEGQIKIRFNKLCRQFENNERYISLADEDQTLSEDESISYEMMVHKKQYQAGFFQKPDPALMDTLAIQQDLRNELLKEFTSEQIEKGGEEIEKAGTRLATMKALEMVSKMPVWFTISEYRGQYYISIYYDNEYNRANGEDL